MKRNFFNLLAGLLLAAVTFASCEKTSSDDGSQIKDDGSSSTDGTTLHESLKGSNYYVLFLDDDSYASIEDKVVADFRPAVADEQTIVNIDVWSGTYTAGTNSGLNFYGSVSGWVSFVVGSAGWSGGAWALYNGTADVPGVDKVAAIADDIDSYYLHFAYKTSQSGKSHLGYMTWPSADTAGSKFAFGDPSVPYVDNGESFTPVLPVSGEFKVGEWNEYEIPLKDMGLDFSAEPLKAAINLFAFLSGGVSGTTLDVDAVFIYKK